MLKHIYSIFLLVVVLLMSARKKDILIQYLEAGEWIVEYDWRNNPEANILSTVSHAQT